jgi:hypothetical protein
VSPPGCSFASVITFLRSKPSLISLLLIVVKSNPGPLASAYCRLFWARRPKAAPQPLLAEPCRSRHSQNDRRDRGGNHILKLTQPCVDRGFGGLLPQGLLRGGPASPTTSCLSPQALHRCRFGIETRAFRSRFAGVGTPVMLWLNQQLTIFQVGIHHYRTPKRISAPMPASPRKTSTRHGRSSDTG